MFVPEREDEEGVAARVTFFQDIDAILDGKSFVIQVAQTTNFPEFTQVFVATLWADGEFEGKDDIRRWAQLIWIAVYNRMNQIDKKYHVKKKVGEKYSDTKERLVDQFEIDRRATLARMSPHQVIGIFVQATRVVCIQQDISPNDVEVWPIIFLGISALLARLYPQESVESVYNLALQIKNDAEVSSEVQQPHFLAANVRKPKKNDTE